VKQLRKKQKHLLKKSEYKNNPSTYESTMERYLLKTQQPSGSLRQTEGSLKQTEGSLRQQSTLELLDDAPLLPPPKPVCLGILGQSSDAFWTKETIIEQLLHPIVSELGRLPESVLVGAEGQSSMLIEWWAARMDMPIQVFEANWAKLGKRARALRDARIVKEATHLLVFYGQRSDTYEATAIRELKKGRTVFTVDAKTHEIQQLELES